MKDFNFFIICLMCTYYRDNFCSFLFTFLSLMWNCVRSFIQSARDFSYKYYMSQNVCTVYIVPMWCIRLCIIKLLFLLFKSFSYLAWVRNYLLFDSNVSRHWKAASSACFSGTIFFFHFAELSSYQLSCVKCIYLSIRPTHTHTPSPKIYS